MQKKPTFSQKVLERKAHRRAVTFLRIFIGILACIGAAAVGGCAYDLHTKRIAALAADAPTWVDFVATHGETYETHNSTNTDGTPNALTISGERWNLVKVNQFDDVKRKPKGRLSGSGTLAETYCGHKTIAYIEDEDPAGLRVSLMHEVFHAGACLHGGDAWWNSVAPDNRNHLGVYHLGEFMATFLHDNPQFVEWEENKSNQRGLAQ